MCDMQLTDEEKAKMQEALMIENPDGTVEKRVLEEILSRRKSKNTYEYEVSFLPYQSIGHICMCVYIICMCVYIICMCVYVCMYSREASRRKSTKYVFKEHKIRIQRAQNTYEYEISSLRLSKNTSMCLPVYTCTYTCTYIHAYIYMHTDQVDGHVNRQELVA